MSDRYRVTADDYKDDPTAVKMVEAGAKRFRDPSYPALAGITVKDAATDAGVTERTGGSRWKLEELQIAIINLMLSRDDPDGIFDGEQVVRSARDKFQDDTSSPLQDLVSTFNETWPVNLHDSTMRAVYALWPHLDDDSRTGEAIRVGMYAVVDAWCDPIQTIIESFLRKNGGTIRFRDELFDIRDFSTFVGGLAETSAFYLRIQEAAGERAFDKALPGKLLEAWIAMAFEVVNEPGPHPVDSHLANLENIDQQS